MNFKLKRFNPRRLMRGAPAAEVECSDEHGTDLLWMTVKDIANNIKDFGPSEELDKAKEHYRTRQEFPARDEEVA